MSFWALFFHLVAFDDGCLRAGEGSWTGPYESKEEGRNRSLNFRFLIHRFLEELVETKVLEWAEGHWL